MKTSLPARLAVVVASVDGLAGCVSEKATYSGRPRDQVWTAMAAVAEQPQYSDWKMDDNIVYVDDETDRIVVYRSLRRIKVRVGAEEVRQDRQYQFEIQLEPIAKSDSEADPLTSTIVFSTLQPIIPARLTDEATRYFAAVGELLGEVKEPEAPRPISTEPPPDVRP